MKEAYKISPYTYKNGHSCYALHSGERPTKDNIILECNRLETIEACLNARKEREGNG